LRLHSKRKHNMTVLSPAAIVGMAMPSLAPASSSGPVGAGLGGAIHDTWQNAANAKTVKTRAERRAAIAKARKAVEARAETKAERLAKGKSNRDTGSEAERSATRGSVAKAAATLADVSSPEMWSDPDFRDARAKLRARYPDRKLSEMLELGFHITALMKADPVEARQQLLAAYSRLPIPAAQKQVEHAKGLRGSLQRAAADHEDMQDLAAHAANHGTALVTMIKELAALDSELAADPAGASARVAVRFGAPVLESEIPAYQAAQATKAHQKAHANILKGVNMAIEHGLIPGDDEHLTNLAHVLQHPSFQPLRHPTDGLKTLRTASAIAAKLPKAAPKSSRSDAGTKSISGGPGYGQGGRTVAQDRGTGGVRDSIARVRAAM
jgi:hypothetical protein